MLGVAISTLTSLLTISIKNSKSHGASCSWPGGCGWPAGAPPASSWPGGPCPTLEGLPWEMKLEIVRRLPRKVFRSLALSCRAWGRWSLREDSRKELIRLHSWTQLGFWGKTSGKLRMRKDMWGSWIHGWERYYHQNGKSWSQQYWERNLPITEIQEWDYSGRPRFD